MAENPFDELISRRQEGTISDQEIVDQLKGLAMSCDENQFLRVILQGLLESVFYKKGISGMAVVGFARSEVDGFDYPMDAMLLGDLAPLGDENNIDLAISALERLRAQKAKA